MCMLAMPGSTCNCQASFQRGANTHSASQNDPAMNLQGTLQTTKSVESVLHDIKAKHDAAAKQLAAAGQDMSKSQGDMDILKLAQQAKLEEIKKLCKYASP